MRTRLTLFFGALLLVAVMLALASAPAAAAVITDPVSLLALMGHDTASLAPHALGALQVHDTGPGVLIASWGLSLPKIAKQDAEAAIHALVLPTGQDTGPHLDQLSAAKRAALTLLPTIPGPFISGNLNGHGNGVGWHKADGNMANDCITVSLTQYVE